MRTTCSLFFIIDSTSPLYLELVYKLDPNMIKSVMNESKESHLVSTSSFDKLHKSSNESKKRGLPSKKIDAKFTSASEIHETSTNLLTDNPFVRALS